MSTQPILAIDQLELVFPIYKGRVQALNKVSLDVRPGEIVGVVGESGSGKSVTAMMAMQLLKRSSYQLVGGSIRFLDHDMLTASDKELRGLRGSKVSMIFQEPMNALNPTKKVGKQLCEVIRLHQHLDRRAQKKRALELLDDMQIPNPEGVFNRYPFELSGGMRQRVLIAMAFSCNPQLIIADEPTTALDVTVQQQILRLLKEKATAEGTAVLFITHDMAVVSQLCDRVYVMYAGSVVESGPTAQLMQESIHPYTQGLLASAPERVGPREHLEVIPGTVPSLANLPRGCAFKERCTHADSGCERTPPQQQRTDAPEHQTVCWHPQTQRSITLREVKA